MTTETPRPSDWRQAVAAWLTLTAPGALVTCAIITFALLLVNELTPLVVVAPAVRRVAAAVLLMHSAMTLMLVLLPGRWLLALCFLGLLASDALLCGLLLSGDTRGPGPLLASAVVITSLEVGGWLAAAISVAATALGAATAAWWGIGGAALLHAAVSFPTTLSIETSFAGHAVTAVQDPSFRTTLSVETWIAGMPAFASAEELFVPMLVAVLAALCLGLATSLWRVRRARTAVAASIVAAARLTP